MRFLEWFTGPKQQAPPPVATVAPRVPVNRPQKAISAASGHQHFLGCLASVPSLAPRDASVRAFLVWLQDLGEADDPWEQSELLSDYESICDLTGVEAMPAKWFGRALEANGCHRWQAELTKDGRRWRPYFVQIPPVLADAKPAVIPSGKVKDFRGPKQRKSARSGTSKRFASNPQILGQRKGERYAAGISNAVA